MQLTNDIFLVGGGDVGFNLSAGPDSHIYVIRSQDELAVVDAGTGLYQPLVLRNMRQDGLDPADVRHLLLTHYHADHAGGSAAWRAAVNPTILGSPETADALARADEERIGLLAARRGGYYPADYHLQACESVATMSDGAELRVGSLTVTAIATPGHCDGHLVFLLTGGERVALFSGDCIFWGGTIVLQNIPDCSIPLYARTMERLAELDFDALLPGHLAISLANGKRHVERAVEAFRASALPRQLQL